MKKIIILITLAFFLTACSYQELNDLALVTGIGIDYNDDEYTVTAEILDLEKGSDSSKINSVFYEGKGNTVPEAIRNIMKAYPKTIYLGHLELIIFGKNSEKAIPDTFNYIFPSPEAEADNYIVYSSSNKAKDIFSSDKEYENNSPTTNLISSIKNSTKHQGIAYKSEFEQFYSDYIKEGLTPLLINIEKQEDKNITSKTTIKNLIPFKENKLYKPLTYEEEIAYNIINNSFYDIMISSTYNNDPLTVIIYNPKSKLDVKIKDNKLEISIDIKLEGHISELSKDKTIEDNNTREELQNIIKDEINSYVEKLINYCKENNTDILGIKNNIYKHYNNIYNNYKDKNLYENKIETNIDLNIFRYGLTYKGLN